MSGEGRIINPWDFAKELIEAVESDPGTERKAMLFYVDGEEIRFVRVRSEARVMTLEFTRHGLKQVVQAAGEVQPPREARRGGFLRSVENALRHGIPPEGTGEREGGKE